MLDDLDAPVAVDVTVPNAARMYDHYRGTVCHRPRHLCGAGKRITDREAIAGLVDMRDDEFYVEIPKALLRYAEEDG